MTPPPPTPRQPESLAEATAADSHLAWQGLRLALPEGWNPIELTGTRRLGGARIGDLHRTRLEIIWRAGSRLDTKQGIWKRYLRKAGRGKSSGERLEQRPDLSSILTRAGWLDAVAVCLQSQGIRSIHALVRSAHRRRFVLLRMPLEPQSPAPQVLLSQLREAAPADSERWCVYGFAFQVPAGSDLMQHELHSGRLTFSFAGRRTKIIWQRYAMAHRILAGKSLSDWLAGHEQTRRVRRWRPLGPLPRSGVGLAGHLRTCRLNGRRIVGWHEKTTDQLIVASFRTRTKRMPQLTRALCRGWRVAPPG